MYRRFIALKYLTSRFITFAALLTVSSGVALLIVILSVMEGFRTDLEERIRGTSADVRVQSRSVVGLRDPHALARAVEGVRGIRAAGPYVETLAMQRAEGDSEYTYFFLQAFELSRWASLPLYLESARQRARRTLAGEEVHRMRALGGGLRAVAGQPATAEDVLSSAWLEGKLWTLSGEARPPERLPAILVGYEAMENLGLLPGRTVRLTSYSPVTNRARVGDFLVAGVLLSRDYQFDSRSLLMPLASALDFLELRDPQTGTELASGVWAWASPEADLAQVKDRVSEVVAAAQVPFADVQTWREQKAGLLLAVRIEKTVVGIILGVLIIFAGIMIFIVLTVQVVEKARDIGILQSLGSTSWGIARIYLLIGSGVCLVGTLLGALLGVAFSLSINTIQRWIFLLVGFELFPRSVYYIDRIPVRLAPVDLFFIIGPTVLASLLASVVPAWRAARKDPVVALRYE